MQLTSTRNWLRLDTFRGRLPDEEEDQGLSERPDVRWVKPKAQTHQSAIAAPSPPWAGGNPTPHVLLLCSLPSDTDREIRASFDRQGRATRPVVDPRVSFRSAFLKAFRPLSRPTGEASRHGSGSPVSIEWRSSPARLITSIIAGRHEPAWGRSLAVAYSPWLWRASVCRTEAPTLLPVRVRPVNRTGPEPLPGIKDSTLLVARRASKRDSSQCVNANAAPAPRVCALPSLGPVSSEPQSCTGPRDSGAISSRRHSPSGSACARPPWLSALRAARTSSPRHGREQGREPLGHRRVG